MAFPNPNIQPPQVRNEKRYFVPNEIGYVVWNNIKPGENIAPSDAIGSVDRTLRELQQKGIIREELIGVLDNQPRERQLPGLSVIFTRLEPALSLTDVELLQTIKDMNQQLYQPVYDADRKGKYVPKRNELDYQVLAAIPNWLTGAQQSVPSGTGGPCCLPVQANAKNKLEFDGALGGEIKGQLETQPAMRGMGSGEPAVERHANGVNVYVLDTAPHSDKVVEKWKQFNDPSDPDNLVQILFGQNAGLNVVDDTLDSGDGFSIYYNQAFDTNLYLPGNHYNMADHGLFVASLIAQQYPRFFDGIKDATKQKDPPERKIHLIQVLSDYGVGTMDSFLWGLEKTINLQSGSSDPAIVNCSWVLTAPVELDHLTHLFDGATLTDLECYLMGEIVHAKGKHLTKQDHYTDFVSFLNGIHALHEYLSDLKATNRIWLFACAGNDRKRTQDRPKARYPAAYTEVIGVTALSKPDDKIPATYANIADDPSGSGFAIWGGENKESGVPAGTETIFFSDEKNSPVGLYFNDAFPDEWGNEIIPGIGTRGGENTTGLAHWAGTSFATPLAAATFAASLAWRWNNTAADLDKAETALRGTTANDTDDLEKTIPLKVTP